MERFLVFITSKKYVSLSRPDLASTKFQMLIMPILLFELYLVKIPQTTCTTYIQYVVKTHKLYTFQCSNKMSS